MKSNANLVKNCGNFAEARILPIYACGRIIQNSVSGSARFVNLGHLGCIPGCILGSQSVEILVLTKLNKL